MRSGCLSLISDHSELCLIAEGQSARVRARYWAVIERYLIGPRSIPSSMSHSCNRVSAWSTGPPGAKEELRTALWGLKEEF
jgi:hypothetical protein